MNPLIRLYRSYVPTGHPEVRSGGSIRLKTYPDPGFKSPYWNRNGYVLVEFVTPMFENLLTNDADGSKSDGIVNTVEVPAVTIMPCMHVFPEFRVIVREVGELMNQDLLW